MKLAVIRNRQEVLRQPGRIAWDIFDARIAAVARQFEDFQSAERAGAMLIADSVDGGQDAPSCGYLCRRIAQC